MTQYADEIIPAVKNANIPTDEKEWFLKEMERKENCEKNEKRDVETNKAMVELFPENNKQPSAGRNSDEKTNNKGMSL